MCIAPLFIITPNLKPSKHLLTEDWINRYAIVTQGNISQQWKRLNCLYTGQQGWLSRTRWAKEAKHKGVYTLKITWIGSSRMGKANLEWQKSDSDGWWWRAGRGWAPGAQKTFPEWWACSLVFLMGGGDYRGVYIYQDSLSCKLEIYVSYCRQIGLQTNQRNTVRGMKGSKLWLPATFSQVWWLENCVAKCVSLPYRWLIFVSSWHSP